jgi:hypothetical protein
LVVLVERSERSVLQGGLSSPVIAGDLGDDLDLGVGEPAQQLGVPDHVVAVLVVTGVGNEQAHVREQRCRLEQLAFVVAETVTTFEPVEEFERELRHLERVVGILVAHLHQVLDAAATQVREMVERRTVQPIVEVEQHALAERVLTDDERLDVERVHHLLEDDRTPDDDVGPPLVDPLDLGSGLRGLRSDQPLDHLAERRPGQDGTIDRLLDRTLGCPSNAEETLDGPRAADRHLERVCNLAMELVRVTEAAALAASRWVGRGDKNGADGAAVDAMRLVLTPCPWRAPSSSARARRTKRRCCSTARRSATAPAFEDRHRRRPDRRHHAHRLGRGNAIAVIAVSERGTMFDPGPCVYMDKIAVGPEAAG